jgi:hypothetical protein
MKNEILTLIEVSEANDYAQGLYKHTGTKDYKYSFKLAKQWQNLNLKQRNLALNIKQLLDDEDYESTYI